MRKILIAVLMIFSVAICIASDAEYYPENWVGKDINELIKLWGPPTKNYAMPNGNSLFTWKRRGEYGGAIRKLKIPSRACKTTFEAQKETNLILSWSQEGKGCPFAP